MPWFTNGVSGFGRNAFSAGGFARDRGLLERTVRHEIVHALTDRYFARPPALGSRGCRVYFAMNRKPGEAGPRLECPTDADIRRGHFAGGAQPGLLSSAIVLLAAGRVGPLLARRPLEFPVPDLRSPIPVLYFRIDPAFLDLVQQRLVADTELSGGAAAVPLHLLQRVFDDRALGLERRGLRDVGQPEGRDPAGASMPAVPAASSPASSSSTDVDCLDGFGDRHGRCRRCCAAAPRHRA